MQDQDLSARYAAARAIATKAGAEALRYFEGFESLTIDRKGQQDLVSEADRNVELLIRSELAAAFPNDGIVGEEHADTKGTTGFTWVIDPIDGTANFVRGIPVWCVAIACVQGPDIAIGVIDDPVHKAQYHGCAGYGAFCNDKAMTTVRDAKITDGSVGIGSSARTNTGGVLFIIDTLLSQGGVFYRNASGALSLAYVASGKLLGYIEEHMHPWDCLAGQLLIAEAGGVIEHQDAQEMIKQGGRVVAAAAGIADELIDIADKAYQTHAS